MDVKHAGQEVSNNAPHAALPPVPPGWWPPLWWLGPWTGTVPGPYYLGTTPIGALAGGDLALQGLAAQAAMDWARQELPLLAQLPAEAQRDLLVGRLAALQSGSLLTADEVQSLLGRLDGDADTVVQRAAAQQSGPPSLYAMLNGVVALSAATSPTLFISAAGAATVALATVGGGYIGNLVAGPIGAWVGAAAAAAIAASAVT